ncbi:MAG: tetratricopeptide repeat protein, partial [Nitrospirae bacterium]|nr:tetratricopeptide repeat protein [Nitrospirota bacterium]
MKKEVYKKSGFTLALILVSATALLIYSNSFFSPFHFDDIGNIIKNSKIRSLANFHNFSGTRYIGELSFALNYHFGRLSVFGYHVVNIVIHIINGLLVWLLAGLTLRTPVMERFKMDSRTRWFIALAASLIFIAHPVQTQAVTYIVQRFA